MSEREELLSRLEAIRESLRDEALSLLNDAVYRGDENAKTLERQCAKVSRAIDKAIHEYKIMNKMNSED
jgi:hypothetical protein